MEEVARAGSARYGGSDVIAAGHIAKHHHYDGSKTKPAYQFGYLHELSLFVCSLRIFDAALSSRGRRFRSICEAREFIPILAANPHAVYPRASWRDDNGASYLSI
jgi:hypothetical protein